MFGDSFKVLEQVFLGWMVIIRSDCQVVNNIVIVKMFGQVNCFCGCIGFCFSDNWNMFVGQFQCYYYYVVMFFMVQCCGFIGSFY